MFALFRSIRLREKKTLEKMIRLYCRDFHGKEGVPCAECRELLAYAQARLDHCPYDEHKPICRKCPIHCYKKSAREKVRAVMRYSGPRLLLRNPLLALLHLIDARRSPP